MFAGRCSCRRAAWCSVSQIHAQRCETSRTVCTAESANSNLGVCPLFPHAGRSLPSMSCSTSLTCRAMCMQVHSHAQPVQVRASGDSISFSLHWSIHAHSSPCDWTIHPVCRQRTWHSVCRQRTCHPGIVNGLGLSGLLCVDRPWCPPLTQGSSLS